MLSEDGSPICLVRMEGKKKGDELQDIPKNACHLPS